MTVTPCDSEHSEESRGVVGGVLEILRPDFVGSQDDRMESVGSQDGRMGSAGSQGGRMRSAGAQDGSGVCWGM